MSEAPGMLRREETFRKLQSPNHSASFVQVTTKPRTVRNMGSTEDDEPLVVIIERRSLFLDCLEWAIAAATGEDVIAVSSVENWLALSASTPAAVIVYCTENSVSDPDVRRDLELLVHHDSGWLVVISSDNEDPLGVIDALENGARGYIPTSLSLSVWVEAIRLVRAGGVFAPAACLMAAHGLQDSTLLPPLEPANPFTVRQTAVIEALRRGKANKAIAYELNMCESTVKVHVRNIMKKLNARNRTEVAFLANEFLPPQTPEPKRNAD